VFLLAGYSSITGGLKLRNGPNPARGRFTESFSRNFIPNNLSQYPETLIGSCSAIARGHSPVQRILLTRSYSGDTSAGVEAGFIAAGTAEGTIDTHTLLANYCRQLYARYGTYEEVARCMRLDRRTVKKYLQEAQRS